MMIVRAKSAMTARITRAEGLMILPLQMYPPLHQRESLRVRLAMVTRIMRADVATRLAIAALRLNLLLHKMRLLLDLVTLCCYLHVEVSLGRAKRPKEKKGYENAYIGNVGNEEMGEMSARDQVLRIGQKNNTTSSEEELQPQMLVDDWMVSL